jgi:hypothetical protein
MKRDPHTFIDCSETMCSSRGINHHEKAKTLFSETAHDQEFLKIILLMKLFAHRMGRKSMELCEKTIKKRPFSMEIVWHTWRSMGFRLTENVPAWLDI